MLCVMSSGKVKTTNIDCQIRIPLNQRHASVEGKRMAAICSFSVFCNGAGWNTGTLAVKLRERFESEEFEVERLAGIGRGSRTFYGVSRTSLSTGIP